MNILGILQNAIKPVTDLIGEMHTSEEEKLKAMIEMEKVKNDLQVQILTVHNKEVESAKEVLLAEANGSWLQRNWRPVLMLSVVAIIVNNYILFPYMKMIWPKAAVVLELPDGLWTLMQIGVGGYILGRSGEKVTEKLGRK